MSVEVLTTVSPASNKPILTRNGLSEADVALLPATAAQAFNTYRLTSLKQRQEIVGNALKSINAKQDVLAKELTEQMGRPISYATKEVGLTAFEPALACFASCLGCKYLTCLHPGTALI